MMSSVRPKGFAGISHLVTDIAARIHEIKKVHTKDNQRQAVASLVENIKVRLRFILGVVAKIISGLVVTSFIVLLFVFVVAVLRSC